jgi:hypothetical protein
MKRVPDTTTGDLFAADIERPGALGCQVEIAASMAVAMERARERGLTRERIAERMTYLLGEKISLATLNGYVAPSHQDQGREINLKRAMAFDAALGEPVLLRLAAEKLGGWQMVSADDMALLEWARLHHEERQLAARKKALEAVLLSKGR